MSFCDFWLLYVSPYLDTFRNIMACPKAGCHCPASGQLPLEQNPPHHLKCDDAEVAWYQMNSLQASTCCFRSTAPTAASSYARVLSVSRGLNFTVKEWW